MMETTKEERGAWLKDIKELGHIVRLDILINAKDTQRVIRDADLAEELLEALEAALTYIEADKLYYDQLPLGVCNKTRDAITKARGHTERMGDSV